MAIRTDTLALLKLKRPRRRVPTGAWILIAVVWLLSTGHQAQLWQKDLKKDRALFANPVETPGVIAAYSTAGYHKVNVSFVAENERWTVKCVPVDKSWRPRVGERVTAVYQLGDPANVDVVGHYINFAEVRKRNAEEMAGIGLAAFVIGLAVRKRSRRHSPRD